MKKLCVWAVAALLMAACTPKAEKTTDSGLLQSNFQMEVDGKKTDLYTLRNKNNMEVCVTNFGGRIVSVMVPDKDGQMRDVVLGFDSIQDYVSKPSDFGASIGRYANRINQGRFTLDGTEYQLPQNNYGPAYGSAEKNFGRILKEDLMPYRDELIITTKAGFDMWEGPYGNWGSRKYLLASLDQSLKRMGLDYVDIFYHHRMDPETPLEETMGALATAVCQGKALYVGLSNYDGETLEQAAAILKDLKCPFVINQNCYSIFDRTVEKNGLKDMTGNLKKGLITFSPLAQGQLTDRYLNGIPEDSRIRKDGRFLKESILTAERMEQIRKLNELAAQRGEKLADMALAWLLQKKEVTSVLIGASKTQQILDNIKAIHSAPFTEEELQKIDEYSL